LDALAGAAVGVPGKGERRGSKSACALLDGVSKPNLWLGCALQGRQRCGLVPARWSNAAWRAESGAGKRMVRFPEG